MIVTTRLDIPDVPAADEIAQSVMVDMLPALGKAFADLKAIQEVWLVNDINGLIEASAKTGEALAGYSAKTWAEWGTAFTATLEALDTPIESIGKLTKQVLLTRYTKAAATA